MLTCIQCGAESHPELCDVCRMENDPVTGFYTMTSAEAAALSDTAVKNRPKVLVKKLPSFTMTVERTCIFCGTLHTVRMNPETAKAYAKWTRGEGYIQDVPGLSVDQREILLSGICGHCLDEVTTEDSQ